MSPLLLHEVHQSLGASFAEDHGANVVAHYGDFLKEYTALRETAGLLDLTARSRLCLLGEDRLRFLNGQVTNDVAKLQVGEGCYAALITAKGKMLSDLNIYRLENEILLDFEPGLTNLVSQRLEKYLIADDVQIVDVAPHYGLLSVQGPQAAAVVSAVFPEALPKTKMQFTVRHETDASEIYLVNHPRGAASGFDLFVPAASLEANWKLLAQAVKSLGGRPCGGEALDWVRLEAGFPRYGIDMDETNLPPEAGLEQRGISYTKGCYIGQEVLARIRTYGQVAKALRGLRLADGLPALPKRGDKLFKDGKEVGFITSALRSPALGANLALGYVRRETNQIGAELTLRMAEGESPVRVVELPFRS